MINLIEITMHGLFVIMIISALLYFGYSLVLSKCKVIEFQGVFFNKVLAEKASHCFEGRHVDQFIFIVKTFKYSFLGLILLMVTHGVVNKFT